MTMEKHWAVLGVKEIPPTQPSPDTSHEALPGAHQETSGKLFDQLFYFVFENYYRFFVLQVRRKLIKNQRSLEFEAFSARFSFHFG